MDKYNFIAKVVKEATLLGLKVELDCDDKDFFIEIYGNGRYFGFYAQPEEREIEFFLHENVESDKRYIFYCNECNITDYIRSAYTDSKKFILCHFDSVKDII